MFKARQKTDYLIKAMALSIFASSTLLAQSSDLSSQSMDQHPPIPAATELVKDQIPEIAKANAPLSKSQILQSEFTGKVQVHCAPLRSAPQADSITVAEVERATLLRVFGKSGDFYQVAPPEGLKAYIASRFVSGESIVGQHVNVRSRPNTESAILGQVNSGDRIKAESLLKAPDWVEIPFPESRKLFIRADLIAKIAGDASFEEYQHQRSDILRALNEAQTLNAEALSQLQDDRPTQISWNTVRAAFEKAQNLASKSPAFSELEVSSKQQLQEAFLKYQATFAATEQLRKAQTEPTIPQDTKDQTKTDATPQLSESNAWTQIEEQQLKDWLNEHPEKDRDHYALMQEDQAQILEGKLIPFTRPDLRQKPGDFILMSQDLPIAYLYSSTIDLQQLNEKTLKLKAVKRDDLGFALPAYCVLTIED